MTFREKLVELRQASGMTQPALSEACGVALQTLRQYEQGHRTRVPFAAVVAIAGALGVSCEAFASCEDVAREGEPPSSTPPPPPAPAEMPRPRVKGKSK